MLAVSRLRDARTAVIAVLPSLVLRERIMPSAVRWFALTFLTLIFPFAHAQVHSPGIRGTLSDKGGPIVDAEVYLQSLEDEHCAKLFAGKIDLKKRQELRRCMHDLGSTHSDEQGHYEFSETKAGWYAVHFLWSINDKPSHPMTSFKEGDWFVEYAGSKDSTGKYDTMAQGRPFYSSGKEDAVRNFEKKR
jgi:hypothetical protein